MKDSLYRVIQKVIALGIILLLMQTSISYWSGTSPPNVDMQNRIFPLPENDSRSHERNNDLTESDLFGGSWFQGSFEELSNVSSSNVTIVENGTSSHLELVNSSTSGFYFTSNITIPHGMKWSHISLSKYETPNSYVNISLMDPSLNNSLIGFINRSESYIDLESLNASSVFLRADFHGEINLTPKLFSWGIEWTGENAWRDSFTGDKNIDQKSNLTLSEEAYPSAKNQTSYLRSVSIRIPPSHSWCAVNFDRAVPDNTILTINIHDAESGELMIYENGSGISKYIDLTNVNSLEHPSIYLQASFRSNLTEMPVLYNWGVNWSAITAPKLVMAIDDIELSEDTPENNIIDLKEHFNDRYSRVQPPVYSLENISDMDNITVELNGSKVNLIGLTANWTGVVSLQINCTNVYNLSTPSNFFSITVSPINDPPAWTAAPPNITMDENNIFVTNYSLLDYINDADGDELELSITCSDYNITVELDDEYHIIISPPDNYIGKGFLNLTVSEKSGTRLASNLLISYEIIPVDDPPVVHLIFPLNGSIIAGNKVTLVWVVTDRDSPISDIHFSLYLGLNRSPELYLSGIKGSSRIITDLLDGETYYWYVIPHDSQNRGRCISGIREFSMNSSISAPSVNPISLLNGSFKNNTDIVLKWDMAETYYGEVEFHILLGTSPMHLSVAGFTGVLEFRPEGLTNNKTYYWKVIPVAGLYIGDCIGGLREFTIDTKFIPVYSLVPTLDINDISMDRKQNTSFNLSLSNDGNTPVAVQIDLWGSLAQYVHMDRDLILGVGDKIIVKAMIRPGSSIFTQPYNMTLSINHPGGVEELILRVNVTDNTVIDKLVKPPEPDPEFDWFWFIMDTIVIIVLILGLGVLFRSNKKKTSDGEKIEEEPEQYGGNVYVVGGLKDDQYEGKRETDISTMMLRNDTDLFGMEKSSTISGIRPPKWHTEPDNDAPELHLNNIQEDQHETEVPEDEVFSHEEPEREEVPPRAPRWHAISKKEDTSTIEKDVTDDMVMDETSTEKYDNSSSIENPLFRPSHRHYQKIQ
ncbi:MAG: Ig-like domain-containing protein [Candidatus Thermoplasmatota archaeon]|jgi:hypothetical protein|nr:Ig-like domain-containing protein [Candidatus Thermoplasmatota archaeon]MDP7264024.1 Ig-like domain-containing protein [Candidatus Thermoplasmatota archaeon]